MGCSSVGRASDRHAADAGSNPRCGKGFFCPESAFSADSLTRVRTHPCAMARINICAHVKNPVVHVRVLWIMARQTYPARTIPRKQSTWWLWSLSRKKKKTVPSAKANEVRRDTSNRAQSTDCRLRVSDSKYLQAGSWLFLSLMYHPDCCFWWQWAVLVLRKLVTDWSNWQSHRTVGA